MHYRPDENQPTECGMTSIPPGQTTTALFSEVTCLACQARILDRQPQPAPGTPDWETFLRIAPPGAPAVPTVGIIVEAHGATTGIAYTATAEGETPPLAGSGTTRDAAIFKVRRALDRRYPGGWTEAGQADG